jgi:hypothetical protein
MSGIPNSSYTRQGYLNTVGVRLASWLAAADCVLHQVPGL